MKKIILSILFLLVTLPILAQQRVLEKVDKGLYEYKVFNSEGEFRQKGFYKEKDGTFFEHGLWKDSFGTKALYEMGKLVWIHPKGRKKYTAEEILIHRLKRRVEKLEQRITSL